MSETKNERWRQKLEKYQSDSFQKEGTAKIFANFETNKLSIRAGAKKWMIRMLTPIFKIFKGKHITTNKIESKYSQAKGSGAGKKPRYLNYLKEVKPIGEYLKDTSKSEKTINTYLLALDKFFPFLVNRFKSEIKEIEDFDYETYFRLDDKPDDRKPDDTKSYKIDIKKKWEKLGIADKIITEYWLPLNANTKSNLLMKWSNVGSELDTFVRKERNKKELKDAKNTYLNYVWRIQGFLTRLGFEYKANPREMSKITTNGFHLSEEITYEDVIKLYEELDKTKYKLILKIIMYCGFNPADVVLLRPTDFERYKDTKLFVLVRKRKKNS